jgi:uncharacterized protein YkwD
MVQKHIIRSVIAPVVVAGILIMAILAGISSNQAFAYNSYKGHHGYYKSSKYGRHGNIGATKTVTTGNEAQQSSNSGNEAQQSSNSGPSSQTTAGNVAEGGSSSQAGHCKAAVTALSASWYSPYSLYQIRGQLTCGGSGLSGKSITLTSSKLSYVGKFGTAVTREDGYFSANYRPASTGKPLNTVSAWYLGGPDEGGIASKVVTPQGGPQSSNTTSTPQESSNSGNGAMSQESSNTGNGRTNTFVLNAPTSSQQSSNTGNAAQGASNTGNTADLANTILAIHNRERAAVGSPALKWSGSLAADAKSWAEHLAQLGALQHATGTGQGENLSYRSSSGGPSTISTSQLIQGWVSEKNSYNGGPITRGGPVTGHYTQMVWKTTTSVGCGTASSGNSVYLVCRYSPPGNMLGQRPY